MSEKETNEKKESKKETKDTLGGIQSYVVQPIMLPIVPTSGPYLADTFNIDPVYAVSTGQLTIMMSFMIPAELSASQVSIKQYYNSSEPTELQFYAVYSSESTTATKQVNCKFKASATDAAGHSIAIGDILNILTMVVCTAGPKSSRGIMSSVRTTEV
jgi:hypothetical protein